MLLKVGSTVKATESNTDQLVEFISIWESFQRQVRDTSIFETWRNLCYHSVRSKNLTFK